MATQQEQGARADRTAGLPRAKLVSRREITNDLMVIKLEPEQGPLKFKPGQYCTLGLDGIERAYSIVSAPHEPCLEIFVELVPEGELTPLLWKLKVGDTVSLRPRPKGIFVMDTKVHHHLMLSTVTGVAPSVSMVRDYLHRGSPGHHHFYILEGASYYDELVYDQELATLAAQHPQSILFVASVSRPKEARNAGWTGVTGRINAIVEEYLEKFQLPKDDTLIYACGHPGMISDAKERVTPKGWRFTEERFWKG
ncbi:MAG: ferredoxin--NADP reductase [Dehalococcoidia bacterium]|nr:ferredoxin--NADP reductase [Dehalococcoidia bacterium]MSQ16884.1 ferredoxin--NADP reductase [Dehalococcoidia bacterium]